MSVNHIPLKIVRIANFYVNIYFITIKARPSHSTWDRAGTCILNSAQSQVLIAPACLTSNRPKAMLLGIVVSLTTVWPHPPWRPLLASPRPCQLHCTPRQTDCWFAHEMNFVPIYMTHVKRKSWKSYWGIRGLSCLSSNWSDCCFNEKALLVYS